MRSDDEFGRRGERDTAEELDLGGADRLRRCHRHGEHAQTTDPQLCRESEESEQGAQFEQGWTARDKLLFKAYWAYKARLCTHHRWES